jgi:hypothetical protein
MVKENNMSFSEELKDLSNKGKIEAREKAAKEQALKEAAEKKKHEKEVAHATTAAEKYFPVLINLIKETAATGADEYSLDAQTIYKSNSDAYYCKYFVNVLRAKLEELGLTVVERVDNSSYESNDIDLGYAIIYSNHHYVSVKW